MLPSSVAARVLAWQQLRMVGGGTVLLSHVVVKFCVACDRISGEGRGGEQRREEQRGLCMRGDQPPRESRTGARQLNRRLSAGEVRARPRLLWGARLAGLRQMSCASASRPDRKHLRGPRGARRLQQQQQRKETHPPG